MAPIHAAVVDFCRAHDIGLVVVGPEAPLVAGIADDLAPPGSRCSGRAKRRRSSKGRKRSPRRCATARASRPRATARSIRSTRRASALDAFGAPVVVKADGLAAGKGVTVAMTMAEAAGAVEALFAESGASAVIEEFLEGEEVSLFVLTDGTAMVPFGTAQDHKRVGDGDTGPNTGGMGAYSPRARADAGAGARTRSPRSSRRPSRRWRRRACPIRGVLYAGLMLTADGPQADRI